MSRPVPPGHISTAEARVLAEYARGGQLPDVAARLYLTQSTCAGHLRMARGRVGATSNVHLLALAITAGDVVLGAPAVTE